MKGTIAAIALVGSASAFPQYGFEGLNKKRSLDSIMNSENIEKRQTEPPQGAGVAPPVPPPFDADLQLVSVSGEHEFVPPGPGDARGPCPGLNAMANHGYIPHNGFATQQQFIDGTQEVFGMAPDLGGFLAILESIIARNPAGWSIDGDPTGSNGGIGGSHSFYEADASPLRSDLHQYGSNKELILSQWEALSALQPETGENFNIPVLGNFKSQRYDESINKNPWFSYQVFSGQLVSAAAYSFRYRFMANKSAEFPEGILDRNVMNSFDAITYENGEAVWNEGHERIPENWYKRHPTDEYSIPYFFSDVLYFQQQDPRELLVGCNQGQVNSFNVIQTGIATNGVYTLQSLLDNPACFLSGFAELAVPKLLGTEGGSDGPLSGLLNSLTGMLTDLTSTLSGAVGGESCEGFQVNETAFAICPGFALYGGPEGEIAPGAVQTR
ncbi:hypothetical protein MBLNU230_g3700t1 [Neophaeotheca triangularis]